MKAPLILGKYSAIIILIRHSVGIVFLCHRIMNVTHIHRNTSDHSQMRQKAPEVFGFDNDVIREIEKDWVRYVDLPKKEHPVIDTSCLYSPLKIGYYSGVRYPADKLQSLISQSRTTSSTAHGRSFDGGLGASPSPSRPSTAPVENK